MQTLPPALAGLASLPQFVAWFAVPHPDKPGKLQKFPCDWRTGAVVGATNRDAWTTFDVAAAFAPRLDRGHGHGVGFCFSEEDPYWFLDIDNCRVGDGWSPLALELCARFPGAAIEVSMSGAGLHLIGQGRAPAHGCRNTALGLEFYTGGRFAALTGQGAVGSVLTDHTAALGALVADYFPAHEARASVDWTDGPVPEWRGPTDDDEIIRRARASGQRNANAIFGDKVTFEHLWTGDWGVLRRTWPEGQSDADQALANHLAFWTGKDCSRIDRLMRRSALARDKWDQARPGGTYLSVTILNACAFVTGVLQDAAAPLAVGSAPRRGVDEYLTATDQPGYFDGCVYVTKQGAVWSPKEGDLLVKGAFDVHYGGYLFVLDPQGRKTTNSAWEAFTLSRVNTPATVRDVCFRPELPSGAVVTIGGAAHVNTYVPHEPVRRKGDAGRFLDFLAKLLPVAEDRRILLNYMASLVQNPGKKFQWWPVIQGCEGNGKTMLIRVLEYCVGEHYAHLPNAQAMARDGLKFNDWVYRKLFIGVEEIYVANRREFLEEFKVVVTNTRMGMEGKGTAQGTKDNRANGLICTNHLDGVPVARGGRRYAVFFTAQQDPADLARDGMDGDYFPDLWDWLNDEGYAIVADYLATFAVEAAYNPARRSHRAPETSSSRQAVTASQGAAEQEVREAIEEGRPGFAGGWVSSKFLDQLLDSIRARVPRNKRREMMRSLGYDWHPGLPDGRVNDVTAPDNGKPKLYIREGHAALALTGVAEIARAYTAAQQPAQHSAVVVAFGDPRKSA